MYSVYVITNTVNGKQYVGYTSKKVNRRWRQHVVDSKHEHRGMYNSPLQIDIRKYGEDVFVCHVVETTHDKSLAIKMEDIVTEELNTTIPNGYNRQVGYHCVHTEDTKKKLSESNSGKHHPMWGKHRTEEARKKISKKLKGRTHSEEARKKMSENHCDNSGANHPRARKCICVETGQTFDTIREASDWCGVKASAISNCCRGKLKTAGGYHWMYYEDYLEQNKER